MDGLLQLEDVLALGEPFDFTHLDDIDAREAQVGLPKIGIKSETLADTAMDGLLELCNSPTGGSFGADWMEQEDFPFPDQTSILSLPFTLDEDLGFNTTTSFASSDTTPPNPAREKNELESLGYVFADEFLHSLNKESTLKLDTPPTTPPSAQDQVAPEIILDTEAHDSSALQLLSNGNAEFFQSPLSPDDVEVVLSTSSLSTSPAPALSPALSVSPAPTPSPPSPALTVSPAPTPSPSPPTTVDTSILSGDSGSWSFSSTDLYKVVENTEKTRPTPYSRPQKASKSKSKGRKQTASISPNPSELELELMSKKDRKKLQNKNAAIRYRQKKKVETDQKRSEVDELEAINDDLHQKCGELEREIKCMRDLINDIRKAKGQPLLSFSNISSGHSKRK